MLQPPNVEFGYVIGLELENIRAFTRLRIDLRSDDGPRLLSVIIGRNGTCKSTLLRCIALGLCHESDASALLAKPNGQLVSEGASQGCIMLQMVSTDGERLGEICLTIERRRKRDVLLERKASVPEVDFFVCGYGAGRGNIGPSQDRDYRVMDSVATLFDYHQSLVNSELMLRRLEDYLGTSRYERAMIGIKQVLGLGPDHHIVYGKGGGVRISGPGTGQDIPFDSWADGYRMTFNWMIDLYGWAMQADAVTKTGGVRGVLLIDEVEQHLHPSMQTELLNELREVLPEIQVFATTHSPLVALGTGSENVISLHRKGNEVHMAAVPPLMGYSAEDALVEEALFGTDPYPRYTRAKLDRHRELSAVPPRKRTKQQADEIRELAVELDPAKLPKLRDDPIAKKLDELAELLEKETET